VPTHIPVQCRSVFFLFSFFCLLLSSGIEPVASLTFILYNLTWIAAVFILLATHSGPIHFHCAVWHNLASPIITWLVRRTFSFCSFSLLFLLLASSSLFVIFSLMLPHTLHASMHPLSLIFHSLPFLSKHPHVSVLSVLRSSSTPSFPRKS